MTRILGIDPGSRLTGFGILEMQGSRAVWIGSGCIRTAEGTLDTRLKTICQELEALLEEHQPQEVAIEQVLVHRNPDSALKLGQARGAAISTVALRSLPLSEYSPTEIKKAIVGKGNAAKAQIQHMVQHLLGLNKLPQEDAADAFAAALCHAHLRQSMQQLSPRLPAGVRRLRRRTGSRR